MRKSAEHQKYTKYFETKLSNYLQIQSENEVSSDFINHRATLATDTYFSTLKEGKIPPYAIEVALTKLFDGYPISQYTFFCY